MTRRVEILTRMNTIAGELERSCIKRPGDYDGRESLWMERENLRAELARTPA